MGEQGLDRVNNATNALTNDAENSIANALEESVPGPTIEDVVENGIENNVANGDEIARGDWDRDGRSKIILNFFLFKKCVNLSETSS